MWEYEHAKGLDDGLRHVGVQAAGGLIAEEDAGVVDQLRRQRHAPHLAARDALGVHAAQLHVQALGEVEVLHDLRVTREMGVHPHQPVADLRLGPVAQPEDGLVVQVLLHRQVLVEQVALAHEATHLPTLHALACTYRSDASFTSRPLMRKVPV